MIKQTERKTVTFFDDDTAITLVKPFSQEYQNMVFVITEDAYGEIVGELKRIVDLKVLYPYLSNDEYSEILNLL